MNVRIEGSSLFRRWRIPDHAAGVARPISWITRTLLLASTAIAATTGAIHGQEANLEASLEASRLRVTASMDVSGRYVFRGYEQDRRGVVFQPEVGVGRVIHTSSTGWIGEVSLGGLIWSSLHAGSSAHPGELGVFELDLGASLNVAFRSGWSASLIYTSYLAPAGAFETIHELAVDLSPGTLQTEVGLRISPHALIAYEVRDGGGTEDTYLELGAELGLPPTGFLEWAVPISAGVSIDGFYRDADGSNHRLGYVDAGIAAATSPRILAFQGAPVSVRAGLNMTAVSRDARLAQRAAERVLWTWSLGASVWR